VLRNRNVPDQSTATFFSWKPFKTVAQKYLPNDVNIILFTNEKTFTVATSQNLQNDRQYAFPSTKKKDVVTKRLRARLVTDGSSRRVTSG